MLGSKEKQKSDIPSSDANAVVLRIQRPTFVTGLFGIFESTRSCISFTQFIFGTETCNVRFWLNTVDNQSNVIIRISLANDDSCRRQYEQQQWRQHRCLLHRLNRSPVN